MGLLVGMIFYPIISVTKRHRLVVWSLRLLAIPLTIILFVVLTRNFYTSDPYAGLSLFLIILLSQTQQITACSWCRYLSCIPIAANNRCQG
jgi:hypothetical protein